MAAHRTDVHPVTVIAGHGVLLHVRRRAWDSNPRDTVQMSNGFQGRHASRPPCASELRRCPSIALRVEGPSPTSPLRVADPCHEPPATPSMISPPSVCATVSQRGTSKCMTTYISAEKLCEELDITRDTLYKWRADGRAPRAMRLPNGKLRFKRTDVDTWLETLLVDA